MPFNSVEKPSHAVYVKHGGDKKLCNFMWYGKFKMGPIQYLHDENYADNAN